MINKEQIAHDLTMVYLNNRYGINVSGTISGISGNVYGDVGTNKLPHVLENKYSKSKSGIKNIFSPKEKIPIEGEYISDDIIPKLINEYFDTYKRILETLDRMM